MCREGAWAEPAAEVTSRSQCSKPDARIFQSRQKQRREDLLQAGLLFLYSRIFFSAANFIPQSADRRIPSFSGIIASSNSFSWLLMSVRAPALRIRFPAEAVVYPSSSAIPQPAQPESAWFTPLFYPIWTVQICYNWIYILIHFQSMISGKYTIKKEG